MWCAEFIFSYNVYPPFSMLLWGSWHIVIWSRLTIYYRETFFQDLQIVKYQLQNLKKILMECLIDTIKSLSGNYLSTTYKVIYSHLGSISHEFYWIIWFLWINSMIIEGNLSGVFFYITTYLRSCIHGDYEYPGNIYIFSISFIISENLEYIFRCYIDCNICSSSESPTLVHCATV